MNHYYTDNRDLKSEIRVLNYSYKEYDFILSSDLGVFSKDKIDIGSQTLVETYFEHGRKDVSILDVGCGYGFMGITLSKIMNAKLDMIDVNPRAIHLSKMNLKKNNVEADVFISNTYENITKKYDVIITNPPIKAGKDIYMNIINSAFDHLNEDGELWFVMRNNHGVKTVYSNLAKKYKTEILKKNKGFYVIMAKNC